MQGTTTLLRNRYRILNRLGSGGMGSVYSAIDLREATAESGTHPPLALKALFVEDSEDTQRKEQLLSSLQQEFRVLATLRHPFIARVHEFGRIPKDSGLEGSAGRPGYFFTRDLVDGMDLLSFARGLPLAEVLRVFGHTAEALDVLHRAGMVHGDFKPGNVIVSADGRPRLIDFGLVRGEGQDSALSGTIAYLAPEVLNARPTDRRADLYALGISLFQVLAGRLPFGNLPLGEIIAWHVYGEPARLPEELGLPEEVAQIVYRLIERDPDRRFPTAAEVALALAEAIAGLGAAAPLAIAPVFVPPAPGSNLVEPLLELVEAVRLRAVDGAGGEPLHAAMGEAGSGKTTLLKELAWRMELFGVEVVRGEFRAQDPRAFGLWPDLLAQVAGIVGTTHPLEGRKPAETERYAVYQEISEYLARSSEIVPLLLILDNGEEADEESRAALRFIAHTLPSEKHVALVVALGTDEALLADLGSPPCHRLKPLSLEDTARMLADASTRRDEGLARALHESTAGNPLHVMEVLRKLWELGWPAAPDLLELAPPGRLEDVIASRLAVLRATELSVVRTLAVLGRPASGRLLVEMVDEVRGEGDPDQVGLPLERLEALEWLDRKSDGSYFFRQGPAARIVYALAEPSVRRSLHSAAARVLRRSPPTEPVELSRHALGAEDLELALDGLDAATSRLRGLGATRQAIQLLGDALALLQADASGPSRPLSRTARLRSLHRELGELYRTVGEYERAAVALEAACVDAQGQELGRALITLAAVHRLSGRADRSLEILRRMEGTEGQGASLLASALSEQAAAHITLDAYEDALAAIDAALPLLAEGEGRCLDVADRITRAELHGRRAWSLGYLERYDEASASFERALADARTGGDRRVEANILMSWAVVSDRQADFSMTPGRYRAALERAREAGDVERVATIRYNLAIYHLRRGDYAECLAHLPESLGLFEAMGAKKSVAVARGSLGQLHLKLGLLEQARATLRRAVEEARKVGIRSAEAAFTGLLALVQARRGRMEEARSQLGEARRLYLELGLGRDATEALLDLSEVEISAGDPVRAREPLALAAQELGLEKLPDLAVRAAALEARLAARLGPAARRPAAMAALDQAIETARALDSPELLWEGHAAAVELADASGKPEVAARHVAASVRLLERMAERLPPDVKAAFFQDERRRSLRERAQASDRSLRRTFTGPHQVIIGEGSVEGSEILNTLPSLDATLPALPSSGPSPAQRIPDSPQRAVSLEERFYRLLEINRQINSELDHDRLISMVMDTVVELTGAERGFLLLGDSPSELHVVVARNLELDSETGAYSRSIAEKVFTSGQPVITVSARNDPRFEEYLSVHQLQLESVLCIPIHARGKTVGVLYMESRFTSGRFTPEDQRLLVAFGDQVAIAIHNAQLLADNIKKAKDLERAKQSIEELAEERGRLLAERTVELEEAQRDLAETRRKLEGRAGMFGMVGLSPPMIRLFDLVSRVAATEVPVLVEGESGTGKEMVARAVHSQSERKKGRLVSVNCAAIPEGLLESELFGHVRGAFTGADRDKKGLFTAAHGGTLFLDEIGDMPVRMQVDLLRALQEKTIHPVGAQADLEVDVRVIAASNRPLASLVQAGRFREDLYYRLNVVCLRLPSLRERVEDVPLLVDHFLALIASQMKGEKKRVTKGAMRRLMEYSWPGNIRQLEHALMNACVLADGDLLDADDFTLEAPLEAGRARTAPVQGAVPSVAAARPSLPVTREERMAREKQRILEALDSCAWNKSKAAEILGIPRRTFYRRLEAYGIR